MTEEEIKELVQKLQEGLKESGINIQTAILFENTKTTMLIDNRKEEDIN